MIWSSEYTEGPEFYSALDRNIELTKMMISNNIFQVEYLVASKDKTFVTAHFCPDLANQKTKSIYDTTTREDFDKSYDLFFINLGKR